MESKKDIRKKIFAERKLRTDEQIEAMSRTITDKVTALPAFKNADRILVYADYNHEVVLFPHPPVQSAQVSEQFAVQV